MEIGNTAVQTLMIFLDETTSGLDEQSETRLYRVLREELPNAMVITVGHRGTLRQLHEEHLELRRSGATTAEDRTGT